MWIFMTRNETISAYSFLSSIFMQDHLAHYKPLSQTGPAGPFLLSTLSQMHPKLPAIEEASSLVS
jgi:hypothetical protein